ncbi:DUF3011 domain-containing protein [Stenotrophomonas tumulicola]
MGLAVSGCGTVPGGAWDDYPSSGPARPYPSRVDVIRCNSQDHRYSRCEADLSRGDDVRLASQDSQSPCVAGRDWGQDRSAVWVNNGCRATFEIRRRY